MDCKKREAILRKLPIFTAVDFDTNFKVSCKIEDCIFSYNHSWKKQQSKPGYQ